MDEMYELMADSLNFCENAMDAPTWENAETQEDSTKGGGGYVLVLLNGEPVKITMERI